MNQTFDRRQLLLGGTLAAALPVAPLAAAAPAAEGREIELWPGGSPRGERVDAKEQVDEPTPGSVPRDRSVSHVTRPTIHVFEPRSTPNGITWLVVPGGGYRRVVIDREGFDTAAWLTERGFGAAVLRYRLPGDRWSAGPDAPVHDALRALRWLRANGGTTAAKLGVIGFSAGGHLCARVLTESTLDYPHVDALDERSWRPEFGVLMYPVIHTTGEYAHAGSAQQLVKSGVAPGDLALSRFDPSLNVGNTTPPTMLVHSVDDKTVPVENSFHMQAALRAAGVASELHVFESGGHGFGLRGVAGKSVAVWPELARNWALAHAGT